jgi:DNA-binding transcriptional ArsR family regulator
MEERLNDNEEFVKVSKALSDATRVEILQIISNTERYAHARSWRDSIFPKGRCPIT